MALKMGISKERSDLIARIALEEESADPLVMAEKSYLAGAETAKGETLGVAGLSEGVKVGTGAGENTCSPSLHSYR